MREEIWRSNPAGTDRVGNHIQIRPVNTTCHLSLTRNVKKFFRKINSYLETNITPTLDLASRMLTTMFHNGMFPDVTNMGYLF